MINGNDEFGMNALMDKVFWNLFSLLFNQETKPIQTFAYALRHILLDILYFAMLSLSVLTFIAALTKKKVRGRIVKTICLNILSYILWPTLLLTFTRVFFSTPLWVVKSYVPDLFFVIVLSVVITLTGGIIKVIRFAFLDKAQ